MARRYDMTGRRTASQETGRSIVDAAWRLLDARAATRLTLEEVARAAGVTRATVYNQLGSRPRLLATVFEDVGRRIGYDRVHSAQSAMDPHDAVVGMLRELARAWTEGRRVIRRILALAVIDPEIGKVSDRYERYRRDEMTTFTRRLRHAGILAPQIQLAEAAAVLTTMTSPLTFDLLQVGTTRRAAADRLVRVTCRALGISLRTTTRQT